MYRDRLGYRELCIPALGILIQRNVVEGILIDVIALDENLIKINFKFDSKFDLETTLKIDLLTKNSALRNLAARYRVRGNFGLLCFFVDMHFRADNFRGYALSGRLFFLWLYTFGQTIFVAIHFRADDFRGYVLSCESNFVDMHFRADVFREYEISGRWVSGLCHPTIQMHP